MTTSDTALPTTQPPSTGRLPAAALQRDDSLDIAKGVGIILVVLGHCMDGLVASSFFPATRLWPNQLIFVIYCFHMPLFFLISGHLASGKHRPPRETIGRLIPTIVYPYFLWSILQGLVQVFLTKYTTSHVPISSLYKILWIPIIPYWFLYALFFCHVGYLLTRKLPLALQLLIAVSVSLAPLPFIDQISQLHLQVVLGIVRGFLYFTLGVVTVRLVRRFGPATAWTATVMFPLLIVGYRWLVPMGTVSAIAIVPLAVAGIVVTLAWSRQLAEAHSLILRQMAGALGFLGRYSMSIYVMHIFFTAGVRIALNRLGTRESVAGTVLEMVLATVLGVVLPLAINWVVSKANADRWFGLQRMKTA